MVSLPALTLSAPSSARSTPAPPLRLPSLSEVAGPELLSLDLVKYSEWLNVLPFYNNGRASLPEPVYDIGFDVWHLAQNKSDRGRGLQAVGLQVSFFGCELARIVAHSFVSEKLLVTYCNDGPSRTAYTKQVATSSSFSASIQSSPTSTEVECR
jgi:hypothetical protein